MQKWFISGLEQEKFPWGTWDIKVYLEGKSDQRQQRYIKNHAETIFKGSHWPKMEQFEHQKRIKSVRGAWVAQSVKHLTSAQVTISRFMSSSPASGSLLSPQSASDPLSVPFSLCPSPCLHTHPLSSFLKNKKIKH